MTNTGFFFFFSSRRRHTRLQGDWSSDVCSSDLLTLGYSLEYRGRDAFVDELFVDENRRRQGIGRKAMQFLERACRDLEVRALHLEVERPNVGAQVLYRKFGFVDHDRYLMTKHIEP